MLGKVACGVSGGVDSAVAALLLKRKGYNVIGVFMRNWDITDETGSCTADIDYVDAQEACGKIGIPFQEVNFVKEYWNDVFSEMVEGYRVGLTPNPDVLCNKKIKFGAFYNYCRKHLAADYIATGHYARSSFGDYLQHYQQNKAASLLKAVCSSKDQSFFLSQIPQHALRRCMFPVGSMLKSDVRNLARDAGLNTQVNRKESFGICFIGRRKFKHFISEYLPPQPGDIVDLETGEIVGQHEGVHQFTYGQRCGIHDRLCYVSHTNYKTQQIFVVSSHGHEALYSSSLTTSAPYWIVDEPSELTSSRRLECEFRFHHHDPLVPCTVTVEGDGLQITLHQALRSITPGQFAVLYRGQECLGSASITSVGPSQCNADHVKNPTLSDDASITSVGPSQYSAGYVKKPTLSEDASITSPGPTQGSEGHAMNPTLSEDAGDKISNAASNANS